MLNRWNFLKTGFYEGIKVVSHPPALQRGLHPFGKLRAGSLWTLSPDGLTSKRSILKSNSEKSARQFLSRLDERQEVQA